MAGKFSSSCHSPLDQLGNPTSNECRTRVGLNPMNILLGLLLMALFALVLKACAARDGVPRPLIDSNFGAHAVALLLVGILAAAVGLIVSGFQG
jgi:hypothetical protein